MHVKDQFSEHALNISALEHVYEVDIKQLCSLASTNNISMLSHLSDFMKCRRNIKFWSMFSSLCFLYLNAIYIFSINLFLVMRMYIPVSQKGNRNCFFLGNLVNNI